VFNLTGRSKAAVAENMQEEAGLAKFGRKASTPRTHPPNANNEKLRSRDNDTMMNEQYSPVLTALLATSLTGMAWGT